MGSVKDIQAHLRHAKADTTANEYMQEGERKEDGRRGLYHAQERRKFGNEFEAFAAKRHKPI